MEMLDENEMGKWADFDCGPFLAAIDMCGERLREQLGSPCRGLRPCILVNPCKKHWVCHDILSCAHLLDRLSEDLKACGDGFYIKCPGFDRIERYCEFEPAIDAAKWKEQVQLDKVAKLEAKIRELDLEIKNKGAQ